MSEIYKRFCDQTEFYDLSTIEELLAEVNNDKEIIEGV
jgi:hypothetical protein